MKHPKRILVATDFSPGACRAVTRAARMAAELGARLDILHAYGSLPRRVLQRLGASASVEEERSARITEGLEAAARLAQAQGVEPRVYARQDAPVAAIEAFLERASVDLVVVGARGERDLRQVLIGSTAERLVERGPCNTLVVRAPVRAAYRAVLASVAVGPSARGLVETAAALAPDTVVHVLHVYEPPYESKLRSYGVDEDALRKQRQAAKRLAQQELGELLRTSPVPPERLNLVLRRGHPTKTIVRTGERFGCDVIVMGRRESSVDAYLVGSVTKQVLRTTSLDVMVVGET